ncbi:hypothetical protein [Amycolatopsis pithecellobii]|uniref:NAD(P)H-binding protein n=1 Tax=Amycolatopsis pithecellobii TaxID=664692 RepID=A0A6N7YPN0_9PSEU|nr:hypothetical protein [Amycolatopsis pithecellobii]MTD53848.1 hypothetical protein [Amycolatopsis pithecellobii]
MITVTGATGNVGSRIVRRLRAEGLEIVAADFDDEVGTRQRRVFPYDTSRTEADRVAAQPGGGRSTRERGAGGETVRLQHRTGFGVDDGRRRWDGELALRRSGLPHAILRPQYFQQNVRLRHDRAGAGEECGRLPRVLIPGGGVARGPVDCRGLGLRSGGSRIGGAQRHTMAGAKISTEQAVSVAVSLA